MVWVSPRSYGCLHGIMRTYPNNTLCLFFQGCTEVMMTMQTHADADSTPMVKKNCAWCFCSDRDQSLRQSNSPPATMVISSIGSSLSTWSPVGTVRLCCPLSQSPRRHSHWTIPPATSSGASSTHPPRASFRDHIIARTSHTLLRPRSRGSGLSRAPFIPF